MSYEYQREREKLFTESGADMLIIIRDNVNRLLNTAGAFRADASWRGVIGDTWTMLAALDYLVERGEIREISSGTAGQHRVFVRAE